MGKPCGYTCSRKDTGTLIYDLLPPWFANRNPVLSVAGRLDKYSSGQVILTDDGDLVHRITHPRTHASKHYKVELREALRGNEAELFASGAFMLKGEEKPLKPARWNAEGEKTGVMVLQEGRYHQIRRMFEAIDNEVVTLHRFQTGELPLGALEPGVWRILSHTEIELILNTQ